MRKEIIPSPHGLYTASDDEMSASFHSYVEMPVDDLPSPISDFLVKLGKKVDVANPTNKNSSTNLTDYPEVTASTDEPEVVKIAHSEAFEINLRIDASRTKINNIHDEALSYNAVYDEMYRARGRSRRGYNAAHARWGNKNPDLIAEPWKYPEGEKLSIWQRIRKSFEQFKPNLPQFRKRVYQWLTTATLLGLALIGPENQGVVASGAEETRETEPRTREVVKPEVVIESYIFKMPVTVITALEKTTVDELSQMLINRNSLKERDEVSNPIALRWGIEGASKMDASAALINGKMISLEQRHARDGVPNELGKASIVSNLENTVIAAHNYLSGAEFLKMENGNSMVMSLKDGSEMTFGVREIVELRSYVATNESGALYYTHFEDSEGQYLSAQDVVDKYYNNDDFSGSVFLQVCINRDGNQYLRIVRLTPQAMEFARKNLKTLLTEEIVESVHPNQVANIPRFTE